MSIGNDVFVTTASAKELPEVFAQRFPEYEIPEMISKLMHLEGINDVVIETTFTEVNRENSGELLLMSMVFDGALPVAVMNFLDSMNAHKGEATVRGAGFIVYTVAVNEKETVKEAVQPGPSEPEEDGFSLRMSTTTKVVVGVAAVAAIGYGAYRFFKK